MPKKYDSNKKYYQKYKERWKVYGRTRRTVASEERKDWKRRLVDLAGGRCVDCGYNAHLAALEFDHLDPTTKIACVSSMLNWRASWEAVVNEVMKCELVCSNCHAIRTHIRRVQMQSIKQRVQD